MEDTSLPLFPLNAILFPRGRLSLQIFEARYLDMIRDCLREQRGFGVVLIERGSEVARPGMRLDIHQIGTYAEVVDWNPLPNGLLGITVEGRRSFQVLESWREPNELCRARVQFRDQDAVDAAPVAVTAAHSEFVDLLQGLTRHPAVEELRLAIDYSNLREVAWRLADLLPISNPQKQALLELETPQARLEQIDELIAALNQ